MFGVLGDGNFRFSVEASNRGIAYYAANHEASAVSMADAWARLSGETGVVSVTKGPGLTNTVTALVEAVKAHTPLLVLVGDTARTAATGAQMIDQARLAESIGVGVRKFRSAALLATDVQSALVRARIERRPVILSIPVDAQSEQVDSPVTTAGVLDIGTRMTPAASSVAAAADALEASRRPVVLAGWGAHLSGAKEAIVELADSIGALLSTTAPTKGMFTGHRYAVGISGGFSSDTAAELLHQADLVISFGASMNEYTTRHRTLYQDCVVIQVDDRPDQVGRNVDPDIALIGDCRSAAEALTAALSERGTGHGEFRTDDVLAKLEADRLPKKIDQPAESATIHPLDLMNSLNTMLPDDATVVTDSGQFFGFPAAYLNCADSGRFLFPQAFQAVGLGLGHAAGAAVARGAERLTVAFIGDGGLRMSLGELEGLVRLDHPVLVVVLNDAAYGAEVHILRDQGVDTGIVEFPDCDFASVARSLGAQASTVRDDTDFDEAAKWLTDPRGVFLLDCKTSRQIASPFMDELLTHVRV
jgi:thiamine pyrophosphate-dependent acetolactate synthase large subunit-like protein